MFDGEGQESTSSEEVQPQESTTPETTTQPETDHSPQAETNPFWGEVESLLGPNNYKLIQPHLAKADAEANKRIAQLNERYTPWKAFEDQQVTPQNVQQALGLVQQINASPEEVYASLGSFLEREGRLPNQAELAQEVDDNDEGDEEQAPQNPEVDALRAQYEELRGYLQNQFEAQQQQKAAAEADTWIESEVGRLKSDPANGYTDDDIKEIIRIAAFQTQQSGNDPENLDAAAAQFNALRDRIRTTPRPGQLAPRLPSGPGGGTPNQATDTSAMNDEQRRALVASILERGKNS